MLGIQRRRGLSGSDISQVVHGLSIPLGKLGFYLPRTISRGVMSSSSEGPSVVAPFTLGSRVSSFGIRRRSGAEPPNELSAAPPSRPVYRIGGTVIPWKHEDPTGKLPDRREELQASNNSSNSAVAVGLGSSSGYAPPGETAAPYAGRTIRFPDEAPFHGSAAAGTAAVPES